MLIALLVLALIAFITSFFTWTQNKAAFKNKKMVVVTLLQGASIGAMAGLLLVLVLKGRGIS